jgi:hypothetical protein
MATLVLAATFALAQPGRPPAPSGLTPPQIGFLRDGAHQVRPLLGISGNFWLGESIAGNAIGVACSGTATILQTAAGLRILNALGHPVGRPFPASGTALFAFTTAGAPALVWMRESGRLLRWNGLAFEPAPIDATILNGSVVSLAAPNSSTAAFVVERDQQLWRIDISLMDGGVLYSAMLPGASAPALLFDDGTLLHATPSALVLRSPQGTERVIEFTGAAARFTPMGRDWVLIEGSTRATNYALRVSTGALFDLPEVEATQ